MENKQRLQELIDKYNNGELTDEDVNKLALLVQKEKIKDFEDFSWGVDKKLFNNFGQNTTDENG